MIDKSTHHRPNFLLKKSIKIIKNLYQQSYSNYKFNYNYTQILTGRV